MSRATIVTRIHPAPRTEEAEASSNDVNEIDGERSSENKKERTKPKKRRAMLTSSQLSDIFTRLDKNGDGVLDLNEFIGLIRLLKVDVSEDYAASVFRSIDQAAGNSESTGTLDMQEFIAAYQKIYIANATGATGEGRASQDSFIRATRYGRMLNGEYVFECYTIPSSGKGERYTLDLSIPEVESEDGSDDGEEAQQQETAPASKDLWDAVCEPWEGTVDDIIAMIQQDSCRNKTLRSNVLWWIDAAYESVDRTTAEEIITRFGLPNDSKFLSSFANFGGGMPADTKSRMFAGVGNHTLGTVYSLSYFAQALWIDNIPVVHHLPAWVRSCWATYGKTSNSFLSRAMQVLGDYYKSHFAWLLSSSLIDTSEDEQRAAYERAEGLATVIRISDEEDVGWFAHSSLSHPVRPGTGGGTIFTNKGQSLPLSRRPGYTEMPSWLQSIAQIHKHPAQVHLHSLSIHILDQGFGAHTLLTVREIDPENQKRFTLEQRSRAGVLGRIISGVWVKLTQVIIKGKQAGAAGELTDSPASLVTFLLMLVHNFGLNSVASVDHWLNVLEKEIKDIVVSKHSAHLTEVERILKDFSSYLDPLEGILMTLSAEQEEHMHLLREENMLVQKLPAVPFSTPGKSSKGSKHAKAKTTPKQGKRRSLAKFEAAAAPALPEDAEKLSLIYSLINTFLGGDPYRELHAALDGYELLDLKGLHFWKERMRKYSHRVTGLKTLIQSQLEEKRNFTTFMLTAITTVLAPMTIFTAYFGMNFDNMTELNSDTNDHFPGVVLLWAICGIAYGILLLLGIHFRILYSIS